MNKHINKIISFLILISLIVVIAGCTANNTETNDTEIIPFNENTNPGANQVMDTENINYDLSNIQMPFGIIGESYNFSFCDPEYYAYGEGAVNSPSDICRPKNSPSKGLRYRQSEDTSVYHFQLDSGKGFQPMGLTLHPNGFIDGKPTALGKNTFSVCAIDESGKQNCSETMIEVKDYKATLDSLTCELTSSYPDGTGIFTITARGTVKGGNELEYRDSYWKTSTVEDTSAYSDLKEKQSSCGTWEIASAGSCGNANNIETTTSWTLVYNLVAGFQTGIVKSNIHIIYKNPDGNEGETTLITKEVMCS